MNKINELSASLIGRNTEESLVSLRELGKEVKSATTSMTSIPKPLKFINPHYEKITEFYKTLDDSSALKK